MATIAKCGSTGSVSLGGEITAWEVSIELDTPEATSMASSGWKEYISCLKSASGTFTSLIPAGVVGSHTGVDFINDNETISMDIIISDLSISTPVDNRVEFSYSFLSTGEVNIS